MTSKQIINNRDGTENPKLHSLIRTSRLINYVIRALSEKQAVNVSLYYWLAGLLVAIIVLREEAVANPVICAAIICAFGSGWSIATFAKR